jgi:hypothetical protein
MNSQKSPAVNRERDCFIRSFRPFDLQKDATPLLIRQNINCGLLCSLTTKQNELWWSDPIVHSVMVTHINVIPDAVSRISDASVVHQGGAGR